MKKPDDYIFDIIDALHAPVLTHAIAWKDCIPERLLNIIPMARLVQLMKKSNEASYPEAVTHLMTRTFEAPMDSMWTEIYLHLSCTVCEQYFHEDVWSVVNGKKELDDYSIKHHLKPYLKYIYEKRRKILKHRMKTDNVQFKEEDIKKQVKEIECLSGQQLSLF